MIGLSSVLVRGGLRFAGFFRTLGLLGVLAWTLPATSAEALPEPGPEDGGMRLRFVVSSPVGTNRVVYDVRIDLMNVSPEPITLQADWQGDEMAGVKDYLAAATSIECVPEIERWRGGLAARERRTAPQPTQVLKAGETLSIGWRTGATQLKGHVSDPTVVQNPTFPFPGLYSVHATLDVITPKGTVRLRSNEQLVSIGGSRAMPKHTYGPVWSANAEKKTAMLGLGSFHKMQVGDRFAISSKTEAWRLTITEVSPRYSEAKLELVAGGPGTEPPLPGTHATLVQD